MIAAEGAPGAACAVSILATCPLVSFDYVDVQKDALLTSTVVLLLGLLMRWRMMRRQMTLFEFVLIVALFTVALDLRKNAVFLIMFLPLFFVDFNGVFWRKAATALLLCVGFIAFAFAADRFIDYRILNAKSENIVAALFVFDLGGIAADTGIDTSGGLLPNLNENVRQCYTHRRFEQSSLSGCREVYAEAHRLMADPSTRNLLILQWLRMIASHPIAYAHHRLAHFACFMRIDCDDPHYMSAGLTYLRPWDAANPPRVSKLGLFIEKIAFFLNETFLASGWFWLLILSVQLVVSLRELFRKGHSWFPFAIAIMSASAAAYAAAYALIGIATELRYLQPTFELALISLPLFVSLNAPRAVAIFRRQFCTASKA